MKFTNFICHRKPERSFFIKGHQFPVCSRCTGFYLGAIVYIIYNNFYFINYNFTLLLIAFMMMIPMAIDGGTQFLGYRESSNTLRLITGLLGGVSIVIIIKTLKYIPF